jgi:GntR family transcriptional regulator
MLSGKGQSALYYQLKELFIQKIKMGEWKVNDRIPTERELCELYDVSRITIRQAFAEMENEGYIYRKQGKGTFVTVPKLEQRLNNFYSFSEEIKRMGSKPVTKMIDFSLIESDANVSQSLNIKKGEKVYAIKRLRSADGEPFTLEISYLPQYLFPDISKEEIEENGLYNTLRTHYHKIANEAIEAFEAIIVSNEEAEYLKAKKNTAALKLERVTKADGIIVEYCKSVIRGDRYKYKVYLK